MRRDHREDGGPAVRCVVLVNDGISHDVLG
jgi:hypothetical protein